MTAAAAAIAAAPSPRRPPASPPLEAVHRHAGGEALTLDIHRVEAARDAPVALVVHGGGWASGDRRTDLPLLPALRDAGVIAVAIDYRLAPRHRWPACLDDVQAAITWTRRNIHQHGGDAARIALVGYSAGGHLALLAPMLRERRCVVGMVGLAAPTDMPLDNFRRGGLSTSMQQLLGRTDPRPDADALETLWQMSPIHHVRPGLPPCLLIHGSDDATVPLNQSEHLRRRLLDVRVPCDLLTLEGLPHDINAWAEGRPDAFDTIARWIADAPAQSATR